MENSRVAGLAALFVLLSGAAAMACGAEPEPPIPDNTTGAVANAKAPAMPSTAQKPTGAPPTTTTTQADTAPATDTPTTDTPNDKQADQTPPTTSNCTITRLGATNDTPDVSHDACTRDCAELQTTDATVTCAFANQAFVPQELCIIVTPGQGTKDTLTRADCLNACQQVVLNQQPLEDCQWDNASLRGEANAAK
jgi:hypothetical protein